MERQDPLRNFRYRLEINSITQAGFAEVTVGELSTDPIEYREGDELTTVRKLNGLNKYANITLKWGITDSTELADWHQLVVDDSTLLDDARRTVVIRIGRGVGRGMTAFVWLTSLTVQRTHYRCSVGEGLTPVPVPPPGRP